MSDPADIEWSLKQSLELLIAHGLQLSQRDAAVLSGEALRKEL